MVYPREVYRLRTMALYHIKHYQRGSILFECLFASVLFIATSLTFSNLIIQLQNISVSQNLRLYGLKELLSIVESFPIPHEPSGRSIISTSTNMNTPCSLQTKSYAQWLNVTSTSTLLFTKNTTNTSLIDALGSDCGGQALFRLSTTTSVIENVAVNNMYPTSIDAFSDIIALGGSSMTSTSSTLHIKKIHSNSLLTPLALIDIPAPVADIDLIKKTLFVGTNATSSQILIFDTQTMMEIARKNLPNVFGSYPGARSIFYFNDVLYVGTHRTAGNEFHTFDVKNPSSPVWLGSVELNHNINQIQIQNHYAFLATSGNTDDVIIVDASDSNKLRQVSALSFNGNEDTLSIMLSGNTLYAGRAKSRIVSEPEFIISDISSSTKPYQLGSLYFNSSVIAIKAFGNFAYIVTSTTNSYFLRIISIVNPRQPIEITKINLLNEPTNLEYQNGFLYVVLKEGRVLTIKP